MSNLQLGSPIKSHVDLHPSRALEAKRATAAALYQCVVVTSDELWGQRVLRDASSEGWDARVFAETIEANRAIILHRVPLVIVHVRAQSRGSGPGYRSFTESLARGSAETLIVVCSDGSETEDEVWARQLGAWAYLPGVNGQSDVALICREAKAVVEKTKPIEAVPW